MYCPGCGKKNEDNAAQCIGCGQNLFPEVPAHPVQQSSRPNISNYLVQAILVTLLCCLPFGIVAIVYAAQVNSKVTAGDIAGAMESSRKAKTWCWVAFGLGLAAILVQGLLVAIGAGVSVQQAQY